MPRFSLATPTSPGPSTGPRFSAVGGPGASTLGGASSGAVGFGGGGDIGGISTPSLFGGGSAGASFPFGAGLATPFGNLGANLPPGLSLPASSGALGQGITALTGSPMAGRFSNAALGGLPGVAGFAASEGSRALGAPGILSGLLGLLASSAVPFGAPPVAGLGLLNSLLGMGVTTAQNQGAVSALNTLANPQNTLSSLMADPTQFGTPQVQALGRFSATPAFSQMASQMMSAPQTVSPAMAQGIQNAQLATLANALDIAYAPFGHPGLGPDPTGVNPLAPSLDVFNAMFGYGINPAMNFGFGPQAGIFGAATGIAPPGSTNFGMGVGDAGVGGGVGSGGGVGGPGAAGGPGSGGEGGNAP